jgi:hypothetical protein
MMKNNRLISLLVALSFLFPALACSLAGAISTQSSASPTVTPAQAASPKAAAQVPTTAPTAKQSPTQSQTAAPTEPPLHAGAPPPATAEITSLSSYKDAGGNFHVVGEIKNDEKSPLTSIGLTLTIQDASGNSLLNDSSGARVDSLTISPMLDTLLPQQSAPFDYLLSSDAGVPDKYDVKISSTNTGDMESASLVIQNAQMKAEAGGMVYLTGEIVNKGNTPVQIYNLAGALLDKDKKVIAAASTYNLSTYLLPAGDKYQEDHTPFSIAIDNPGNPISYTTYLEANQVEPRGASHLDLNIINNYFDGNDRFHIIGSLTNNSDGPLSTFLIGGLYAKDGTVLDADAAVTPIDIPAGQSLPYDISDFGNVNNNKDEAALVDNFTVQVDRSATLHPSTESVALKTSNEQLDKSSDPTWQLNGQITNTSNKTLSKETVMIAVYDAKNELVASDWTVITPASGSIAPGETSSFNLYVSLDPKSDRGSLTYKTFAAGDVE